MSVCIITYNQAEYIEEAVDSVLEQQVDFEYELIVGDDCSTDGTREILCKYQQKHPDRIRLNLHESHYDGIPGRKNMVTNLESARGKYVALLDGDDYWISTNKLQKQTEVLEEHPRVSLSFHRARFRKDPEWYSPPTSQDRFFTHAEIVGWPYDDRIFVPTASMMFRRDLFVPVPNWFWDVWNADNAMQMYLSQHGKSYYHHDLLSYYRNRNANSVSVCFEDSLLRIRRQIKQVKVLGEVSSTYQQRRDFDLYRYYRSRTRILLERHQFTRAAYFGTLGAVYFARCLTDSPRSRERVRSKLSELFKMLT